MEAGAVRKKYESITRMLIETGQTITAMESCTSGLIASLLTDTEGASTVMKGAFVTYSNEAKIRAGVPAEVIRRYGVYSEETAAEMAVTCRKYWDADFGIGVTGTFGNADPANGDSVPGSVYYAVAAESFMICRSMNIPALPSRHAYKLFAADQLADALLEALQRKQSGK